MVRKCPHRVRGKAAQAEAKAAKLPEFEVVSLRQNRTGGEQRIFGPTPDGFRAINVPLIGLFQIAYVPTQKGDSGFFRGSRISGAPDWLTRTERFDVVAKVAEPDLAEWQKPAAQPAMLRAMMRALLEGRFKAAAHIDSKEMPVFDLTVTKDGPKFKAAETVDAADLRTKHPGAITAPDGAVVAPGSSMRQMNFFGASLATLTPILSYLSERPVQDKTGLTGRYDFTTQMSFNLLGPALENALAKAGTPANILPAPPLPPGMEGGSGASPGDSEPSVFSVVQDLGLKLEPAKGLVETLVIDHIERPSEN
jgi:bla regulator protein blaR1